MKVSREKSGVDLAAERSRVEQRREAERRVSRARALLRIAPPGAARDELRAAAEGHWPALEKVECEEIIDEACRLQERERGRRIDPEQYLNERGDVGRARRKEVDDALQGIVERTPLIGPDDAFYQLKRAGIEIGKKAFLKTYWPRRPGGVAVLQEPRTGNGAHPVPGKRAESPPAPVRPTQPIQPKTARLEEPGSQVEELLRELARELRAGVEGGLGPEGLRVLPQLDGSARVIVNVLCPTVARAYRVAGAAAEALSGENGR